MATQVLDEMVVRITGDQTRYKKAMDDAVTVTKKGTAEIKQELDQQAQDADNEQKSPWKKQAKNIKALGKAASAGMLVIGELADENTKLGKTITQLSTAAVLASINPYIGVAMGLKALVGIFKHEQSTAEKFFDTIIDGSRSVQQALNNIRLDVLREELKKNQDMAAALEKAAAARQRLNDLLNNITGLRTVYDLQREQNQAAVNDLNEELTLREDMVGVTGELLDIERRRRALLRPLTSPDRSHTISPTDAFVEQTNREAAEQSARVRGIDLRTRVITQIRDLRRAYDNLGISAQEALAREAEAAGRQAQADTIREIVAATDAWRQAQENQNRVWQESQQLFERTRTPTERIQEEIESINRLFARGTLDVDTYTRAIIQQQIALQELQATQEQFDAVRSGSAAARARLEAQRNLFQAFNLPADVRQRIQRREGTGPGPALVVRDEEDAVTMDNLEAAAQLSLEAQQNIFDGVETMIGLLQQMLDQPRFEVEGAGF